MEQLPFSAFTIVCLIDLWRMGGQSQFDRVTRIQTLILKTPLTEAQAHNPSTVEAKQGEHHEFETNLCCKVSLSPPQSMV